MKIEYVEALTRTVALRFWYHDEDGHVRTATVPVEKLDAELASKLIELGLETA